MATYPTAPRSAFLAWCQGHAPVFSTSAADIGLTPAQATAFAAAVTATQAASLAQEQAKQASRVATAQAEEAYAALRTLAGDAVRTIRAFAESAAKPDVIYNLAQIPAPATPKPVPAPAQPIELRAVLNASSGALTLRWKASNPRGASGTSYIVRRKLPTESGFSFVGVTGKKAFVDADLVTGTDSVQYTVQGQRADAAGPVSEVFTVNFGRLPSGELVASVERAQPKLAA